MALLIHLFQRKLTLVQRLKECNNEIEKVSGQEQLDLKSKPAAQVYNWIAIQLQVTNSIIEPVLNLFRVRKIK